MTTRGSALSEGEPAALTASADAAIEAHHVGKVYRARHGDEFVAMVDVNFTIGDGEFVAVVGPSGCGKSTLLRIVAGLLSASSGVVRRAGRPVMRPGPEIGIVFQSPVLLPWRTVRQNVMLPIECRGGSLAGSGERVRAVLTMVGLEAFADRYPHELSGGMQQRAGIARALVTDPKILLMDEPFGALDAMTREHLNLEVLRLWGASRKTVLFVTHSIAESVFLSDRVLVMTARPGTLSAAIDIDLPRPRELSVINTERAGAYMSRIRSLLHAQGSLGG